jgi:hypothetical protein
MSNAFSREHILNKKLIWGHIHYDNIWGARKDSQLVFGMIKCVLNAFGREHILNKKLIWGLVPYNNIWGEGKDPQLVLGMIMY